MIPEVAPTPVIARRLRGLPHVTSRWHVAVHRRKLGYIKLAAAVFEFNLHTAGPLRTHDLHDESVDDESADATRDAAKESPTAPALCGGKTRA